ncbi:MAG: radical SAM protein [Pseudomonadota bacterium]
MKIKKESLVFGPVPSRRLGLSLGLDLAPRKTCTLDCLYCEVGRTTNKTVDRFNLGLADKLLGELKIALEECGDRLDYVTLAGSGEPTLNAELGLILTRVKTLTEVPVAVLTNGTLLHRPDVRAELMSADLVIPSLDTARKETFARLNRPAAELDLDEIIKGLIKFRQEFPGRFWLEVLLTKGCNDSPEELEALREAIGRIKPELVQMNTVYRPPAFASAKPVSEEFLAAAARFLGPGADSVKTFSRGREETGRRDFQSEILAMLGRRPLTLEDAAGALGLTWRETRSILDELEKRGLIHGEEHDGQLFFRESNPGAREEIA